MSIESRTPEAEYRAHNALNISALKEMRRSPLHYLHRIAFPRTSPAMALGTAAHVATLEPERFASQYAIWDRVTDSGRAAPRSGKAWDAFVAEQSGRLILTASEAEIARAIAHAVRHDPVAVPYLATGEPEVVMRWQMHGRECKGRVDWLTRIDGKPVIVGLKTARDPSPFPFGAASAKLGYHLQWAWYHDGYLANGGLTPRMVEIVVESAPPHAVVVYQIPGDVIEQGREEYERLLDRLTECEDTNHWPGPAEVEQVLTLPTWVYGEGEDDISELGLEAP